MLNDEHIDPKEPVATTHAAVNPENSANGIITIPTIVNNRAVEARG